MLQGHALVGVVFTSATYTRFACRALRAQLSRLLVDIHRQIYCVCYLFATVYAFERSGNGVRYD